MNIRKKIILQLSVSLETFIQHFNTIADKWQASMDKEMCVLSNKDRKSHHFVISPFNSNYILTMVCDRSAPPEEMCEFYIDECLKELNRYSIYYKKNNELILIL